MPDTQPPEIRAIQDALSAPFDPKEVKWKPSVVKNNRAMVIAYISARTVMDRLDDVLGLGNWSATYRPIDGGVVCTLKVKIAGEWSAHEDVGGESEQPDEGDRTKASFSDALKRAAVHVGVGRFLYKLPSQWVDYDPAKKQLAAVPQLPAWAIPKPKQGQQPQQGKPTAPPAQQQPATTQPPATTPPTAANAKVDGLPTNGQELHRRLQDYDQKLASQKLCVRGALLAHVTTAGVKAGYTANMTEWSGPAIPFAVDIVKVFELSLRKPEPKELWDQLDQQRIRTGRNNDRGWADCMTWLNSREPSNPVKYTPRTRYVDIPADSLKALIANLKTHAGAEAA